MNKHALAYRQRLRAASLGACALLQLAIVGCAPEGGDSSAASIARDDGAQATDSTGPRLLAEVALPGYSVSYYETEPGNVLELERGEPGARVVEPRALDAIQRYEFLSGEKAPAALVAALQRAGGDGHKHEPIPAAMSSLEGTPVQSSQVNKSVAYSSEEWFRANYCQPTDRFWGTSGDSYWTGDSNWRGEVEFLRGGVYAVSGELTYRMGYSGGNIRDQWWGVHEGQYAAWRNTSTSDRVASSVVRHANGASYLHCLNYHF